MNHLNVDSQAFEIWAERAEIRRNALKLRSIQFQLGQGGGAVQVGKLSDVTSFANDSGKKLSSFLLLCYNIICSIIKYCLKHVYTYKVALGLI
jgi:hypothetical protein